MSEHLLSQAARFVAAAVLCFSISCGLAGSEPTHSLQSGKPDKEADPDEEIVVGVVKSGGLAKELHGAWDHSKTHSALVDTTKAPRMEGVGPFVTLRFDASPTDEAITTHFRRVLAETVIAVPEHGPRLRKSFEELLDCGVLTSIRPDGTELTRYYALAYLRGDYVLFIARMDEGADDMEAAYLSIIRDASGNKDLLAVGGDESDDPYYVLSRKQE